MTTTAHILLMPATIYLAFHSSTMNTRPVPAPILNLPATLRNTTALNLYLSIRSTNFYPHAHALALRQISARAANRTPAAGVVPPALVRRGAATHSSTNPPSTTPLAPSEWPPSPRGFLRTAGGTRSQ